MGAILAILTGLAALAGGFVLGVHVANTRHKAQRGMVMAQTLQVARDLIYSEMASPEFHMACMAVVHPDARPNDGYKVVRTIKGTKVMDPRLIDYDQEYAVEKPKARSWLPWLNS